MRIALDFDGTIADAAGLKIRYARERYGVELTEATSMRPGAIPLIGEERYEAMLRDVFGTPLSLEMEPMPGAVETLQRLQDKHELHIVTARYDHEGEFAAQWLERRGVEVRSLNATNRGPKVDWCVSLRARVLFEDSVGELAHFLHHGDVVAAALLETAYNATEARDEGWHVVPDWAAFEGLVKRLEGE